VKKPACKRKFFFFWVMEKCARPSLDFSGQMEHRYAPPGMPAMPGRGAWKQRAPLLPTEAPTLEEELTDAEEGQRRRGNFKDGG